MKYGVGEQLAVGATTSILAKTALAPLERMKLLLQTQHEIVRQGKLSHTHRGVVECAKRTYNVEGMRSLWRGNVIGCTHQVSSHMLKYALKDTFSGIMRRTKTVSGGAGSGYMLNMLAGGLAGIVPTLLTYPLDLSRTKLATDTKSCSKSVCEYASTGDVWKKVFAKDGVRGLYRGFGVACLGVFMYRGFYFGLYDSLKTIALRDTGNVLLLYTLGYIVTVTSGLMTYPFDTIRQRMMVTSGHPFQYERAFNCFVHMLKNEGVVSLWRGASVSILLGFSNAALLVIFDRFNMARKRRHHQIS